MSPMILVKQKDLISSGSDRNIILLKANLMLPNSLMLIGKYLIEMKPAEQVVTKKIIVYLLQFKASLTSFLFKIS